MTPLRRLVALLALSMALAACSTAPPAPLPTATMLSVQTAEGETGGEVESTVTPFPLTPSPLPLTPSPLPEEGSEVPVPADWTPLTDPAWGFTFSIPPAWNECTTTPNSHVFCAPDPEPGGLLPPAFYVTVIPPGFTNAQAEAYNFLDEGFIAALADLPVGDTLTVPRSDPTFFTYTRLPDVTVAGEPAILIENQRVWEAPPGVHERRVLLRRPEATYLLGAYYDSPEALATVESVLATFHLTP